MANLSSSSSSAVEVDASVWRAVVGSSVEIPSVNSYVYYFPEGHLEHSSAAAVILNYNFALSRPFIPCQVLAVRFLSDPSSDRPFVKMLLHPFGPRPCDNTIINIDDDKIENDVVSFAKALTPSDANNGGGFSVPKFCAEMIFPPLGLFGCSAGEPPAQNLTVRDAARNHAWVFRHIYRGTPRRHLLSTGWSRFVKAKRLATGDAVVFMKKKSTDELFVGVRRAQQFAGEGNRDGRREAVEAIRRAAIGMEFEVVYYPKFGLPDFVVRAEKVKDALKMRWMSGMRVRMAVDSDDFSRVAWFQGTIAATASLTWFGSPWRMLQVNWDEREILHNRVCPWQVEHIPLTDPYCSSPPSKKLKAQQNIPGLLLPAANGETESNIHGSPARHDPNNSAGLHKYSTPPLFLGGIQGARRDDIRRIGQTPHELPRNDDRPGSSAVSTVLSIGSSWSGDLSGVHGHGTDHHRLGSQHGHSSGGYSSFRLFGKNIIQMAEPVGGGGTKRSASCTYGGIDCTVHRDRCWKPPI